MIPDYIEARIRQLPPASFPVVRGSTPVISFGDARRATVATLGWNPSKREFLDPRNSELISEERRLETLSSLGEAGLATASSKAVFRIFDACNRYFHRNPYHWFNRLEKILKHIGASYHDGSACHLDFVQWATDPVWGKLSPAHRSDLLRSDVSFLRRQLAQEHIQLLLLNGAGIVNQYRAQFHGKLTESHLPGRLKLFTGYDTRGTKVVGWNINLQSSFGVSEAEIKMIGEAVGSVR